MNSLFTRFMYRLLVTFMSFCALISPKDAPAKEQPIKPLQPDVKMTAVLWGDTHLSDYVYKRYINTVNSFADVGNAAEPVDVLVLAGDITENGRATEYRVMLDNIKKISTVRNYIFAVGNHDMRLRSYRQIKNYFTQFCKEVNTYTGDSTEIRELSFAREINGYTFIVLGSTRATFEEAYFGAPRLEWLKQELVKASRTGRPIFVVCHQPFKLTHNLPKAWGGSRIPNAGCVGPQNDRLRGILNGFDNIIYISGHLHSGFSKYSYEKIDNFHSINLPAIGPDNADGCTAPGSGYVMEVYEDCIIFRARCFAAGKYLPEYDIKIDLT